MYYWDYAAGIFLISLALAFTMGSTPGGDLSFTANSHAAAPTNLFYAALGGFIFNIANFLLIAGIGMVGLAIAFPISIGIALVEGVVLSYLMQPKGSAVCAWPRGCDGRGAVILIGKAYGEMQGKNSRGASRKGIVVCVVSGILMGVFAPFITRAMTASHPLTPYTAAVLFTFGAFLCCFVFNVYMMKHPLEGEPVRFGEYFRVSVSYHVLGLLGGAIWGLGTVLNFVAASLVGVAISYAIGQASPMVAALWGVFVWHEFRGANDRAKIYLVGMFACYVLALVLIARAYQAS